MYYYRGRATCSKEEAEQFSRSAHGDAVAAHTQLVVGE